MGSSCNAAEPPPYPPPPGTNHPARGGIGGTLPSMRGLFPAAILAGILLIPTASLAQHRPVDYVNPLVGSDGHGHTFPGPQVPFGMVQLSPDTRTDTWDGSSGYHYSDKRILGFSHTHLNGTGV